DFDLDVRIRCGLRLRDHPAECRQGLIQTGIILPGFGLRWSREASGGNTLRGSDCGPGNLQPGKLRAGLVSKSKHAADGQHDHCHQKASSHDQILYDHVVLATWITASTSS